MQIVALPGDRPYFKRGLFGEFAQSAARSLAAVLLLGDSPQKVAHKGIHRCPVLGGVDPRFFKHGLIHRQGDIFAHENHTANADHT